MAYSKAIALWHTQKIEQTIIKPTQDLNQTKKLQRIMMLRNNRKAGLNPTPGRCLHK